MPEAQLARKMPLNDDGGARRDLAASASQTVTPPSDGREVGPDILNWYGSGFG